MKVFYFKLLVFILLCCSNNIFAQDSIQKNKISRTWITLNIEPLEILGTLYAINDSSIVVSNYKTTVSTYKNPLETIELNFNYIETIKVRKRNSVAKGVVVGAVSGFVFGLMVGFISGDDPPCQPGSWFCLSYSAEQKAIMAAVPLTFIGAGLGALLGTIKVKIPINGSRDEFVKNRSKINNYAMKKYYYLD